MTEYITIPEGFELAAGQMTAVDVDGVKVAIAKIGEELYAFADTCTHKRCPLSKGTLEGATVTCPCHGSQFDVSTGAVLNGPAEDPVATYSVRVDRAGESG